MSESERVLYGAVHSGHSHRVQVLLEMLELPYRFEPTPAERRCMPQFLALNPLGQIPVLQEGETIIADSNAILVYLALAHDSERRWLPADPLHAARVQRWLSIAAGEVRHGPGAARLIAQWGASGDSAQARAIALKLFEFMEGHLERSEWLAGGRATIADLANYSYIAHSAEGALFLDEFPAILAWLARVRALPRFSPMPPLPHPARTLPQPSRTLPHLDRTSPHSDGT
jgi:glutathione S-transferase